MQDILRRECRNHGRLRGWLLLTPRRTDGKPTEALLTEAGAGRTLTKKLRAADSPQAEPSTGGHHAISWASASDPCRPDFPRVTPPSTWGNMGGRSRGRKSTAPIRRALHVDGAMAGGEGGGGCGDGGAPGRREDRLVRGLRQGASRLPGA